MLVSVNIDLILITAFLILNLGLGLWHGKDVKSMQHFALGERNFSTGALTATLVATWIGGSSFNFGLYEIYTVGILALCSTGQIFNLSFTAYILAPRMQEFLGKLSIAELLGSIYGNTTRIIVAICSIIKSATVIALQIKIFSTLFYHFFGVSNGYATVIGSMIVIIYSAFGGIQAVVLTDVFQFLTFGAFIPTLALLIWHSFGNLDAVINTLTTNPIFDPKLLLDFNNPTVLKYYGVFFYCLIPDNPAMFQRILLARNTAQASKAFSISAIICLLFWMFCFFIGIVLLSSNLNIEAINLLPYIIDSYTYPGFKAMVVIGIIAMIMSTADSSINSASVIFINDLCKPLGLLEKVKLSELAAVKVFSIAIGLIGLSMALSYKTMLEILLFGASFYTSIIGIPLLFTILGFRSTPRVILSGMIAGVVTTYIWNKYFNEVFPIGDIVPATLTNLIVMMASHYILREPDGWVGPTDRRPINVIKEKRKQRNIVILNFFCNLPKCFTWKNILAYCNDDTYQAKNYYTTYVVFTTISLLLMALVSDNSYIDKQYGSIINAIIIIFSLGVNTLLLYIKSVPASTGSFLEEFNTKYLGFIWHITIFCSLIFSSTMLALVGGFNSILAISFSVNLTAVSLLLGWHTALFMILTGVPLATSVFGLIVRCNSLIIDTDLIINNQKWNIVGSLALISTIMAIIKLKQDQFVMNTKSMLKLEDKVLAMKYTLNIKDQKMEKLLNSKQYIFNNLSNDIKSPMSVAHTTISLLHKFLPQFYNTNMVFKEKKKVINTLNLAHSSIKQLVYYSNNLFDLSQFEKRQMVFNIELNNLELLIKGVIDECKKMYGDSTCIITLDYHLGAATVFEFDYLRMRQVILNLLVNAIEYAPSAIIQVKVMPYRQGVQIIVEDQGVGIPDAELEKIFEPFEESSSTKSQTNGRGLGLAVAREVILHHHGTITASNRTDRQGSKFTIQLPTRQPQGNFNNGMHSKNKIFGNPQTYEQCIAGIIKENPVLQQKVHTVQSLNDIEDHVRTHKSIMIIDDDQSFLDSVSLDIYSKRYQATPVNNAFEAIKMIKETPEFYSMILLDMNMPGKTGDQVLRAINDITGMYSIPVIIVSGFEPQYDTRILLYSLGAATIIFKPCNKDDIRDLINRYLRPSATSLFTPSNSNKYRTT